MGKMEIASNCVEGCPLAYSQGLGKSEPILLAKESSFKYYFLNKQFI